MTLHLARIKKEGTTFEIDVDPDKALSFKKGLISDVREVLIVEAIFSDAHKGLHASEERMKAIFGTADTLEVAESIIKNGEIQLTSDHRAAERKALRAKIVGMIHANCVDPRTGAPHPPSRVDAALEEGKIRIDDSRSAEEQLNSIITSLRPIIPLKIEMKKLEISLPVELASKLQGTVRKKGTLLQETWNTNGSWSGVIEIPGGLCDEVKDYFKEITHGRIEITILNE